MKSKFSEITSSKSFAITLCILNAIIFCFHFFAAKDIMRTVPPMVFAASRGVIGGLILMAFLKKDMFRHLNFKLIRDLFLIAFLGFFLNQICFMFGLKMSTPLNSSIIMNTIPLFTTLMAMAFSLEAYGHKKMVGILMGLGLVVLLAVQKSSSGTESSFMGDMLIFLNVVSFCLAMTLAKKIVNDNVPNMLTSTAMILFGGLMLLAFSFQDLPKVISYTTESWSNFGIMFFEIVFTTSLAYLFNFMALKVLPPSQTMIFIYMQPPVTAFIEFALFKNMPPLVHIPIFIGIIFSGYLVLSNRPTKRPLKT